MSGLATSIALLFILILACFMYIVSPNKERSNSVGFRTRLSKASTENWRLSQKLFYILSISCQLILVGSNLLFKISPSNNALLLLGYMVVIFIVIQSILYRKQRSQGK